MVKEQKYGVIPGGDVCDLVAARSVHDYSGVVYKILVTISVDRMKTIIPFDGVSC